MKLIFATGNENKMREIREILAGRGYEILSMKEAGIDIDVEENGKTFSENALIKARAISEASGELVLADDSGLEIDALGGEPGIYSARYLGYDTDYNYKMEQIMKRMENVPDPERTARFVAAVGAVFPDGSEHVVEGAMEGMIAHGIYGQNGFVYHPFSYLPEYGMTSAEITEEQKNAISHRGKALRAMIAIFDEWRSRND